MKLMFILSALSVLASSPVCVQSQPNDYFSMCSSGAVTRVREHIEQDPTIVDMVDENGATCLHLCSINRSYEIAELLIKNGANVNAMATHDEGGYGLTPLSWHVRGSDPKVVKLLLDNGADVNAAFGDTIDYNIYDDDDDDDIDDSDYNIDNDEKITAIDMAIEHQNLYLIYQDKVVMENGKTWFPAVEKTYSLLVEAGGLPYKELVKTQTHEEL